VRNMKRPSFNLNDYAAPLNTQTLTLRTLWGTMKSLQLLALGLVLFLFTLLVLPFAFIVDICRTVYGVFAKAHARRKNGT
jgi:hypothetical protein